MNILEKSNVNKWNDSHRPWALPKYPWTMHQTWSEVLFIHYPIQYDVLRKLVPDVLNIDSYNGTCWIGVVPFHMSAVRLRGLPPIPGTDQFPELNVRTYVTLDGKPGVYFFSLDAANRLAVKGAKTVYHLPYWYARMEMITNSSTTQFTCKRVHNDEIELTCSYHPTSDTFRAEAGSFEHWMVERYCFYTLNKAGVPLRCNILHEPWTLQTAEARLKVNTILSKQNIHVEEDEAIVHYAKKIDVRAWPLVHHSTERFHF